MVCKVVVILESELNWLKKWFYPQSISYIIDFSPALGFRNHYFVQSLYRLAKIFFSKTMVRDRVFLYGRKYTEDG